MKSLLVINVNEIHYKIHCCPSKIIAKWVDLNIELETRM